MPTAGRPVVRHHPPCIRSADLHIVNTRNTHRSLTLKCPASHVGFTIVPLPWGRQTAGARGDSHTAPSSQVALQGVQHRL